MKIEEILKSFELYEKEYKREAVDAAIAQQNEITPHLISVLEDVLSDPEKFADHSSNYFAHNYAFILLGYFGEEKAHDVIVNIASLSKELPDKLFGDTITNYLSLALLQTCGGNVAKIKKLILNKDAYEFSRGAAIEALAYAYIEGYMSREEIVSFYRELFTGKMGGAASSFYDILAGSICDIYPEELMENIKEAYDEGLLHSWFVGYDEFVEAMKEGRDKCINRFQEGLKSKQACKVHGAMSWWACFQQPQRRSPPKTLTDLFEKEQQQVPTKKPKSISKHNTKKKKSKRKQAKASKKANRKKR
ncbi:MAG: DUF1186 domain-containing protein [Candidatus Electrothrix sp. MAN1_4]|nr:DUF1186 domain-containing protein [Candidatus Electrothrix sp. MAN1_4]